MAKINWRYFLGLFRAKWLGVDKRTFKMKNEVDNIYGKERLCDQQKRFRFVHYVLKYKLLVPVIYLFKILGNKHLIKTVPRKKHLKNLRLFEDSFEDAQVTWEQMYMEHNRTYGMKNSKRRLLRNHIRTTKMGSNFLLRTLKELILTLALTDDAYLEFMNILMHETYIKMLEAYKPPFKENHVLHTAKGNITPAFEVTYFQMHNIAVDLKNGKHIFEVEPSGTRQTHREGTQDISDFMSRL